MSNKDVKQDALDNLADALTEDILNTPDDELLREVEEDYGDPRALANKFDQILERAEKQVQVRSSVLDLPVRWVKGIFDLGSRLSELLSSLRPRTLAWSATAALVVILVQAAVITAVLVKEQGGPSGQSPAQTQAAVGIKPSDEEIAALVAAGRQLIVVGDIPNARLVLQQAADAGSAPAALALGGTYDPLQAQANVSSSEVQSAGPVTDVAMARAWYEKARDLGSTEARVRLDHLTKHSSGARYGSDDANSYNEE